MSNEFEQISIKPGFMKHNGGVLFRAISENEYEFKSIINENHLNAAGITHGGYLSALIDAGAGTAAHRAAGNAPCVTISLITGEEKIIPSNARFFLCTVESMPIDKDLEFVGVDEIQMCADHERSYFYR